MENPMDDLQRRILEIAMQLPGYLGYETKERRRDMDLYTRGRLRAQYDELHTSLARIRQKALMAHAVELENLDQKILRLIARLDTAPRGYAGWFDAAQIGDADLDALTQFDAALVSGVPKLKSAMDKVAAAVKTKQDIDDAIDACAELLDTLNAEFDQREQFLATGKKPSASILTGIQAESALGALQSKDHPLAELVTLSNLKLNDAVTYDQRDYIIAGKITYSVASGAFWAFLLQDGGNQLWLRVGPGNETAVCQQIELDVPSGNPIMYSGQTLTRGDAGSARVAVEGAGGAKRGGVEYARYTAGNARLWVESFGTEIRTMFGQTIDPIELNVYRR
jgi:hypothetical protein